MLLEMRERRLCPPHCLLYSVGGSVDSYRYGQGRNEHGGKVRGWSVLNSATLVSMARGWT